jgi:hypothetical protein
MTAMAKVKGKGTALQISVANVFTTIAALIDLKLPTFTPEMAETRDFDSDAGIGKEPTGYVDCGSLSANYFLDPALSIHDTLYGLLETPANQAYKLIFANSQTSDWAFNGGAPALGGQIDMKDFVKGSIEIQLDGLPTFSA